MASSSPSSSSPTAQFALSNREQDDLMKQTKKDALQKCDGVVKEFAACSTGRTFSVAWACRSQYRNVQECMKQYTSEEAMTEKRREFLKEKRLAVAASTQ